MMSITDLRRDDDPSPALTPVPDVPPPPVPETEKPVTAGELTQAVGHAVNLVLDEQRRRGRRRLALFAALAFLIVGFLFFGRESDTNVVVVDEPVATLPLPGNSGTGHVAIIPIDGEINGELLGPPIFANTTLYIHDVLTLVEAKQNVAAVIFYINSNGGDAVASAQGYRMIKQWKERTKIPVYAYVSSHAYSGGYYLAIGADKIVVDPEASIGNIGVIMRLRNFSRLSRVVGVTEEEVSTGPRKNAGSPWRELSPDDRAMMQREIDQAFDRFVGAVAESRRIPKDVLLAESKEKFGRTSGAWFSAKDAVANNLADKEGTFDQLFADIRDVAAKKTAWKKIEFIRYDKKLNLLERWKDGARKTLRETLLDVGTQERTLLAK